MALNGLEGGGRMEKFGIICKIKLDDNSEAEPKRTCVFRKDVTPDEEDYRDLMKSGKWLDNYSTDRKNKKWEWGTHYDYLGKGTKLLLYDKLEPEGITIIADVIPEETFIDKNNYYKVRNVLRPFPKVLDPPIPSCIIVGAGLTDPSKLGRRPFEDITELQFNNLLDGYEAWKSGMPSTKTPEV